MYAGLRQHFLQSDIKSHNFPALLPSAGNSTCLSFCKGRSKAREKKGRNAGRLPNLSNLYSDFFNKIIPKFWGH